MNEKELRIGNYYLTENGVLSVLGSIEYPDGFCHLKSVDEIYCYSEKCNPVPLTEEWLIKFGFEIKQGAGLHPELRYCDIIGSYCRNYRLYTDDFSFHAEVDKDGYYPKLADIRYVHQFQNLYFALAGTELTIQP